MKDVASKRQRTNQCLTVGHEIIGVGVEGLKLAESRLVDG